MGDETCTAWYRRHRDEWAEAQNRQFARLGGQLSWTSLPFIIFPMVAFGLLAIGITHSDIETDPVELWVQEGSRLEDEKGEYEELFGDLPRVVGVQLSDENVLTHRHLEEMYAVDAALLDLRPHVEERREEERVCGGLGEAECKGTPYCRHVPGAGCLVSDAVLALPSFLQRGAVTTERFGVRWGMRELCMEAFGAGKRRMPCSRQVTPMDCLREPPASLFPGAPEEWLEGRPVSRTAELGNLSRALGGVCRMWSGAPHVKGYAMGGLEYSAPGVLSRVGHWKLFYPMLPARELVRKYAFVMGHPVSGPVFRKFGYPARLTEEQAEEILEGFDRAVDEALRTRAGEAGAGGERAGTLTWMTRWKVEEIVDTTSRKNTHLLAVAVVLLLAVVWGSLFRMDAVTSRMLLGTGAVGVVCVGVAGMMGFMALCGVPYNGLSLRVLPYVALGLGIDDMFVLLHYFDEDPETTVELRMRKAYAHGGPSVTATSLVNLVVFLLGLWIPVKAVRDFALQSAVAVVFNYVAVLLSFGGLMALDAHRIRARRVDVAMCFKRKQAAEAPGSRLAHFVARRAVVPAVTRPEGQAVVAVLTLALLGVSVWGCTKVERGLALSELVEDGVEKDYLEGRAELATETNFLMGREGDWESPEFQMKLNGLVSFAMNHPENVFGLPGGRLHYADKHFWVAPAAWSTNFRWFALQFAVGWAATNDPCKCTVEGGLQRRGTMAPECIVDPTTYLDLLGVWLGVTPCRMTNGTRSLGPPKCKATRGEVFEHLRAGKAAGLPTCLDLKLAYENEVAPGTLYRPDVFVREAVAGKVERVVGWRVTFANNPVEQSRTAASLEAMEETRELLDGTGLPVYAYGPTYLYNEQYLYSRENLRNMLVVMLCVAFVLMSALMASVRLGAIQVCVIGMSMVSTVAALPVLGMKLNSMSTLCAIFGVGINVEMTIHISRSFLMAQGTRAERVASAMVEMSAPVAAGGLTTFFGVLVLAFSGTAFLRSYFFGYISTMVALALFHSFGALPILLFWLGPPALPPHDPDQLSLSTSLPHPEPEVESSIQTIQLSPSQLFPCDDKGACCAESSSSSSSYVTWVPASPIL